MSIQSDEELEALRAVGRIVARTLREMARRVRPGISTAELDAIGAKLLEEQGARLVYGFPGAVCISVNDEIVHGIPGEREVAAGDLVKLDLTAEKGGYMADAAVTVAVPPASERALRLAECAERAFQRAMREARARRSGFSVVRELCGHGIGRTIHEEPQVPNYWDPRQRRRLSEGLVITVEPILAAGRGEAVLAADGWTMKTADHSLSAHYEHTIVITRDAPILLTAA
jgi:methionyl aminopeptidase